MKDALYEILQHTCLHLREIKHGLVIYTGLAIVKGADVPWKNQRKYYSFAITTANELHHDSNYSNEMPFYPDDWENILVQSDLDEIIYKQGDVSLDF